MRIYEDVESGEGGAWPIRMKPLPDELLTSWIVRQAHAHFYKVEKLSYKLFGRGHGLWSSDLDRFASQAVLEKISQITATPLDRAMATTLRSLELEGRLPDARTGAGTAAWVVTLHRYHRARLGPGLMYCPRCLGDGVAYFRRSWRFAFNTVCTDHRVELLDVCPDCKRPVEIHRVDVGPTGRSPRDGALVHCWNCGFDLSLSPAVPCAPGPAEVARLLSMAVDDGWIEWAGNPGLHAIPFLSGVRLLARLALSHVGPANAQLESLPVRVRRNAMDVLAPWLRNWPHGLRNSIGAGTPLKHSDVVNTRQSIPFWLERDVATFRRHQAPKRSETEVAAIVTYLSRAGPFRANDIPRKLGIHIGKHHSAALRPSVSAQAHEALLVHIDQRIGGAVSKLDRLAMVQDKVMFCLYRFTDLSLIELCALRLERMPQLPHLELDDVWWNTPCNRVHALKAMLHHVQRSRPAIKDSVGQPAVFISAYTGRPLGATALHKRFNTAVRESRLAASIPSLQAYKLP